MRVIHYRSSSRSSVLLEASPHLGGSAVSSAVGKVEDYNRSMVSFLEHLEIVLENERVKRSRERYVARTLLDAVLLGSTILLLLLHSLDAVVEVVLGGSTLGGVLALCN